MIEINSWLIFVAIITNLIGILSIYFFIKHRGYIAKARNNPHGTGGDEMMCPFLAAFRKAKELETLNKTNEKASSKVECSIKPKEDNQKSKGKLKSILKEKTVKPKKPTAKSKPPQEKPPVETKEKIEDFYEHIPSHVKKLKQQKLMSMNLKPEEIAEEAEIRRQQLKEIYELMGEKSDLFGINSIDEIQDQMRLYVQ